MNDNKCPCEECISFAICYHMKTIKCEILYKFLCIIDETKYLRFMNYIPGRGLSVYETFNKYVINTNILEYKIFLNEKNLRTHSHILYVRRTK